jgi:uncharacterized delta-60 repeat protein
MKILKRFYKAQIVFLTILVLQVDSIESSAASLNTIYGVSGVSRAAQTTGVSPDCGAILYDGRTFAGGAPGGNSVYIWSRTIKGVVQSTFTNNFVSTTTPRVRDIIQQQDGKIIFVGKGGNNLFRIRRSSTTGALDGSFGSNGEVTLSVGTTTIGATAVALQTDGKILVAGSGNDNFILARYLTNGSLDSSFGDSNSGKVTTNIGTALSTGTSTDQCYAMAVQRDGKIVLGGSSNSEIALVRYTTSGALDISFGTNGVVRLNLFSTATETIRVLALQDDGSIIACGGYYLGATTNWFAWFVAKFNSSGSVDTSFASSGAYTTGVDYKGMGTGLALRTDGSILFSGQENGIFRLTSSGSLDTNFGPSGLHRPSSVPTPALELYPQVLKLQQNNRILLFGEVSSTNAPAVSRSIYGSAPEGCIDVTYPTYLGETDTYHGFLPFPASSSAAYNSTVKALKINLDNSMYVVSEDYATTTRSRLVKLSSTGATDLSPITISQLGVNDVITDSQSRVLVCGTDGNGWLRRYTTSGALTADTTFGSSGLVNATATSSSFKKIGEKKAGRIIVAGQGLPSTTGALFAYDQTGDVATYFGTNGIYSMANTTIDDMVIGSDDGIYIVYKGATNLEIRKVKHDGSGLVAAYNSGSAISTGLAHASHTAGCLALDSSGKLLFVTVNTSTGDILFRRYTTTGALDVATTIAQTTHLLTSSTVITSLQCTAIGLPIFAGYDTNLCFMMRLNVSATGLDTNFNPISDWYKNPFLVPGVLKFMYNSDYPSDSTSPKRKLNCLGLNSSGAAFVGGHEAMTSSTSTSFVVNVTGFAGSQVARYPGASVGSVNSNFATSGEQSLWEIKLHNNQQITFFCLEKMVLAELLLFMKGRQVH